MKNADDFFDKYKKYLEDCVKMGDTEIAHSEADKLLRHIAMRDDLSVDKRRELVRLYDMVDKWYA